MVQRKQHPSAEPTLHELDTRLKAVEKKLSEPSYFSNATATIATLIAVISLTFTALSYLHDRPMLTVAFGRPVFFHPRDLTHSKEPDWFHHYSHGFEYGQATRLYRR